jgi:SAM-dependent methyltransferase
MAHKSEPDYYARGYHSAHQKPLFQNDDYFMARAELALDYFTPAERRKRVFDYGCGVGASIALLPDAAGWDVSAEAREACRRRGVRVHDQMENVPRGAYDVVLCRHVLEHVEAPLDALRTMRALLRDGGTLILVLPRERHWLPRDVRPDVNRHLYCWNVRAIWNLLWLAGFEPVSATYCHPFGAHRLMFVRRLLGPRVYRAVVRAGGILRRNGELVVRACVAQPR